MPSSEMGVDWPDMPAGRGTVLSVLGALRVNGIQAFPRRCIDAPVIVLRLAGAAVALVSGPEAVRTVLLDHPEDFQRMPAGKRILGPIVGDGLLTSEGETWRRQRRVLAPAFTPRAVSVLAEPILRCTQDAVRRIAAAPGPIDLLPEMQRLSLDIAAATMFSIEADEFGTELRAMITGYMADVGRPALQDFLLPGWLPTWREARRAAFKRRWSALIGDIVAKRLRLPPTETPRDLFDLMHAVHGAERPGLLADEVATMMVAGHETTALALFWACLALAAAPDVQDALAAEADDVELSSTTLPMLARTRAVVNETLRLFPPAFLTARQAVRSRNVCDVTIPAGANILLPIWLLHRHPSLWPSPDVFDPWRWLTDAEPDRGAYLPFGVGPHVCIGAQLAITEAVLVLASLTRRLTMQRADAARVRPSGVLALRPDRSVQMIMAPRAVRTPAPALRRSAA